MYRQRLGFILHRVQNEPVLARKSGFNGGMQRFVWKPVSIASDPASNHASDTASALATPLAAILKMAAKAFTKI